jgi:hypothetical protein
MTVLCCYTSLHPATRRALSEHAPGAELADVTGDRFAYWREIAARWNGTDDLVTVEHDIEIHAGVLPGFEACPGLWCVYPYEIHQRGTWLDFGLGCTRFRAQAQRLVSGQAIQGKPGTCENCQGAPGCWTHLDCKIYWAMTEGGLERCVHWPAVTHHGVQGDPVGTVTWHRIAPLEAS